jgi:hypothetical protein
MNLNRYIQGIRKGHEINRLERKAIEDSFLADAMEGYDKIRGDHEVRIKRMQDRISAQTRQPNHALQYWSVAAGLFLIIAMGGGYLLLEYLNRPKIVLVAETAVKPPDTIPTEKPDEIVADSPAEKPDKQKEFPTNSDEPEETIIVKDEEVTNDSKMEIEMEMLTEADTVSISQPVTGINAYNEYLKTNLIRPEDEECRDTTGVVSLSFSIDKNGRPYNIQITKPLCPLADWEAMRLIREGPNWTVSELIATANVYF